MAQQGAGNAGWPIPYDDGNGYGLAPTDDDMNGFINMSSIHPQQLDVWPSADDMGNVQGLDQGLDQAHQNAQFGLNGHQEWAQYQLPPQSGHSPQPGFANPQINSNGFSLAAASQPFGTQAQGPVSNMDFGSSSYPTANDPMTNIQFLPNQLGAGQQWPPQQQRPPQPPQQRQQIPQQRQQQQHLMMQTSGDIARATYSTTSPVPNVPSPAPRQSSGTPDPFQTQNWQGQDNPPLAQHQHLMPQQVQQQQQHQPQQPRQQQTPQAMQNQSQIHLERQQQQQQLQQQLLQQHQQAQHLQKHQQLSPPQQQAVPIPQAQQLQQVPQIQQASPPAPAKATKAARVTKPKAAKVSKAKQTAQAMQAAQQAHQQLEQMQAAQQAQQTQQEQQAQQGQQEQSMTPQQQQQRQMFTAEKSQQHQQQQPPPVQKLPPNGWAPNQPIEFPAGFPADQQQHFIAHQVQQLQRQHQEQQQQQMRMLQQQQYPAQSPQQQQQQQPQQPPLQPYLQSGQRPVQQAPTPQQLQQAQAMRVLIQPQQHWEHQQQPGGFQSPAALLGGHPNPTFGQSSGASTVPAQPTPVSITPQPTPITFLPQASAPSSRPKIPKVIPKKVSLADTLPRPISHLVSAADTLETQQLFPGAPFLALGNIVEIEPPSSTAEPAIQPDPQKQLGKKHFPGRKTGLPCEIVAEYDRLVNSQPPEKKDALIVELRSKLKALGKILPPKVYKFASSGDQIKKVIKSGTAATAIDSPDSDEEEEEEVRSAVRPEDPADAAAWDAIGHVYVEENGPSTIKRAVKNFGDFIKGIYDGIKETKEKLKKAEERNSKDQIDGLKKLLSFKQELLYRAVDAADEKGHEQVLENLGGNGPLVANLVSALRDCVNAADFNGKLPKTLLRFMSQFTTVTDEMLNQKLKFDKIQKRFMTKGDDEVKGLVGEIVSKTVHSKPERSVSDGKGSKPMSRVPSDSASSKRPREEDSDSRSTKKIATNSASGGPLPVSKPASMRPGHLSASGAGSSGSTSTTAKPWAGTALLPGKPRVVTKPTAVKPEVKSDSSANSAKSDAAKAHHTNGDAGKAASATSGTPSTKKDSADSSSKSGDAAKAKKAAASKATDAGSLASQSKLGMLLDEISKPKAKGAPAAAPTPDSASESVSADETPEERAKRLRKESRKKLRVTWKSGDELTQVRVFTKDIDEDEGRAKYLLRDAGDDRSEGLALKASLKKGANLDDEDDDEDKEGAGDEDELPYRPWFEPSLVDFSVIPADKRGKAYTTRGGTMAVQTEEQKVMAERENTVLMAIYADPADVPPTPKSPAHEHYEPAAEATKIPLPENDPKLQEMQTRWNDARSMEPVWVTWNAIQREEVLKKQAGGGTASASSATSGVAKPTTSTAPVPGTIHSFNGSRAGTVLNLLLSDAVKGWKGTPTPLKQRRMAYSDPAVQRSADFLEEVSQQLKNNPFPATEPPSYISDPERVKEWWTGYNREKQRAGNAGGQQQQDNAAAWANYYAQLSQQQQQQQQQQQPAASGVDQQRNAYAQYMNAYYQQQQQQPQAAHQNATATDPNAQLNALLATLGGTVSAQPAAAPQNDPQMQALLASLAGGSGAGQQQQQPTDQNQAYMLAMAQWAAGQQQGQPQQQPQPDQSASQNNLHQDSHRPGNNSNNGNGHNSSNGGRDFGRHRRDRERGDRTDRDDSSTPQHLRGINRALIGTKACVFWASGKCAKGDKCTFRHD